MRTKYNIKWYGLFLAILLVAAGLWSATATAQDTIKVGIITDRVGNSAAWAKPIEAGLELALSEINGAGGVLGKKIELVYESDQSKPDVSATKARKLMSLRAPGIGQVGTVGGAPGHP